MPSTVVTTRDYRHSVAFSGSGNSTPIGCEGQVLAGLFIPSSGWVATTLTFQVSPDGGVTWRTLYDAAGSGAYQIAATQNPATGGYIGVDMNLFLGVKYLRIVQAGTNTATIALAFVGH